MGNRSADKAPRAAKPVKRIELNEENVKRRWILIAVFGAIAIIAFAIGLFSLLNTEPGWQVIKSNSVQNSCSGDFIFNYCFGKSEESPSAEYKRLVTFYTTVTEDAYKLFSADTVFDGVGNIASINANVNKTVTLDKAVYDALDTCLRSGSRYIYMAPLHTEYNNTFFGNTGAEIIARLDPYDNEESAAYYASLAAFARDGEHIELVLLDNNQVRLNVSDEYLAFAAENDIHKFVDLFRIKNAFVADYLASELKANGFVHGNISSYDGFVRNIDGGEEKYFYNMFDRIGNDIAPVARVEYGGGASIVYFRNYPLGEQDAYSFYLGEKNTVFPFIDIADGLYRSSRNGVISMSKSKTCAEIALELLPIFIAEDFDVDRISALVGEKDIHSVWCEGDKVCYNSESFAPVETFEYNDVAYKATFVSDDK